ncbi:MAG TPA: competence protein CoiA family protein [Bacillus sp. (in: firmicutes)]|nr:competence protein CoiA family protein [Bacillus sp. (in: firmicutes)]
MLVAQNLKGELVSILSYPSRQRLRQIRGKEKFYCPICKEEVKLKVGNKNTPHFAHCSKMVCEGETEGESEYHLLGKQQLFAALQKQYKTELEPYLFSIRQRPDLLVKTSEGQFPIEFQCAPLSDQRLCKRTRTYEKGGYRPVWILGAKRYKRIFSYLHELSSFEWNFLRTDLPHSPFLLYYSSLEQHLIQLQYIYPFSAKMVFAAPKIIPLQYVNISHFYPKGKGRFSALFHVWNNKKKRWRLSYMVYRNKQYEGFLRMLYEGGIPASHFPAEAGIPHPFLYEIETPACIWQAYVLFDLFSKRTVGNTVTWNEIVFSFSKRIRQREIILRHFSLNPVKEPCRALDEYIEVLCALNMLKRAGEGRYELLRRYTIPNTTNDAFIEDTQLLNKLKQI